MVNSTLNTIIAITMGDYNGIGPEIVVKSLIDFSLKDSAVILVGSQRVLESINVQLGNPISFQSIQNVDRRKVQPGNVYLHDIFINEEIYVQFGHLSKHAGWCAGKSIEKSVDLAAKGDVDCMVTAPVSKQALMMAGYKFPGQTEMLAQLTNSRKFLMMLLVDDFRVSLVTTHCAISEISDKLSEEVIFEKIKILDESLKRDFSISEPLIAVTALNPHASDGGAFGFEEKKYISPAIEQANQFGVKANGPFPADTLFAKMAQEKYDGYLVMYHDQGLIPLKMKSKGRGVNFTAGLPIIRTSPDHGTAFDIAGKFIARPESMREAIKLGRQLARKRNDR